MASRAGRTPPAAAVRYHDWRGCAVAALDAFAPREPVSVVVPHYEAPRALAMTLRALAQQRFPRRLIDVVVVDDGSRVPPALPETPLRVRLVRQERRGFGLARARNRGLREARHDVVVFLDGDMVADPDLLRAHARWHEAVANAVTMGFRAHVPAAAVDEALLRRPPAAWHATLAGAASMAPWRARDLGRLAALRASRENRLYQIVEGANVGVRRAFFERLGGFDESFVRWGGEDNEFAFRAFVRGGLLVPEPGAFAWHQGPWDEDGARKRRSSRRQRFLLAQSIPAADYRPARPGCTYRVPQHAVALGAGAAPVSRVVAAAEAVLADPVSDLALAIDVDGCAADDAAQLRERFGADCRVAVGRGAATVDAFPATPYHAAVPASAAVRAGLVLALRLAVHGRASVAATLADGSRATMAQAWALNRARDAGRPVGDFGDVGEMRLRGARLRWWQAALLGDPRRALDKPRRPRARLARWTLGVRRKRAAEAPGADVP